MIKYLHNNGILYIKFKGDIKLIDIINHLQEFSELDLFSKKALLVYDFLKSKFVFSPEDLIELSLIGELSTKKYSMVRVALIVDQPQPTAYTILYSQLPKNNRTKRKVFSTKEEALRWINSFKD